MANPLVGCPACVLLHSVLPQWALLVSGHGPWRPVWLPGVIVVVVVCSAVAAALLFGVLLTRYRAHTSCELHGSRSTQGRIRNTVCCGTVPIPSSVLDRLVGHQCLVARVLCPSVAGAFCSSGGATRSGSGGAAASQIRTPTWLCVPVN